MPFVVSELRSFVVFSVQHHLPYLRKDTCDVGRLEVLMRHKHAFVTESDLLRVWIAEHVNIDRPIAGDEKSIAAGRDAAKAPPRHDPAPLAFFERHRTKFFTLGRTVRFGEHRRLGQV